MSEAHKAICPNCREPLQKVRQDSDSMLNAEQFDAVRAGDWFCSRCPEAGKRYRYFWDRDLHAKPEAHKDAVKNDERGAFEAWWMSDVPEEHRVFAKKLLDSYGPDYTAAAGVADAWEAWQAALGQARAASPQAPAVDGAEGYAFRSDGKLWVVTDPDVAMKWQAQGFEVTPVTAAPLTREAATVPEGWKFAVDFSDDRAWLTITTPHGASASLSCAEKNDSGRTIQGQVLMALKEALAASPAAESKTLPRESEQ